MQTKQEPPKPPKDLPPLPSEKPTSEPPKLELPSKDDTKPMNENMPPPLPPAQVAPAEKEEPTKSQEMPELKPIEPIDAPEQNVPPPPAPASKDRSIRSVSDIPPIKLDSTTEKQGIITDRHVQDLDVDKLVLPDEQEASIVQAPVQKPKEEPMHLMPEPEEKPQPAPRPAAPPRPRTAPESQEMHRAYTGPLYVDVPTYEEVQEHLQTLKQDLSSVATDVDTISRLNNQEAQEFAALVERLERIQDRVLGIDKSLFEER